MRTNVLLSIKPCFAEAILAGTKRYEFRRMLFRRSVEKVLMYASSPVCRIVGEFDVGEILEMRLDKLWKHTALHSGIDRTYFDAYFRGLENGRAIAVKAVRRYRRPLQLTTRLRNARPPQSFCYVT
jgi:predicted transcriptional regulator